MCTSGIKTSRVVSIPVSIFYFPSRFVRLQCKGGAGKWGASGVGGRGGGKKWELEIKRGLN